MKKLIPFLLLLPFFVTAQYPLILSERQQAEVIDEILEDRMENLLPELMREQEVDMWVIISREYNEDPVMKTMLPSTWLNARRRTIFVFWDDGEQVKRQAIARYDVGKLLTGAWNLNTHPNQWDALVDLIEKVNPKKIALNFSKYYAHADGLSYTEHGELMEKLPAQYKPRIVSAATLAVRWLETRTAKEMVLYEQIGRISHDIIAEAFSNKVIQPGVTTTDDVVWWMRQKIADLGLATWFHPTVDVQRYDPENFDHLRTFSSNTKAQTIIPGDLLHCDFGITYLRLNTDQQQHAYVLKPGENDIPAFLKEAFKQGNRVQDILTENFKSGLSGNEILDNALAQVKSENILGTIYTHPIGFHGHAAGPTIGMWDNQGKTVGNGDYLMQPNTAYSIELNAAMRIEEWNKTIRIMLEEDGYFDGQSFRYIDGRQKDIMVVER
jgi:hypothetical protein